MITLLILYMFHIFIISHSLHHSVTKLLLMDIAHVIFTLMSTLITLIFFGWQWTCISLMNSWIFIFILMITLYRKLGKSAVGWLKKRLAKYKRTTHPGGLLTPLTLVCIYVYTIYLSHLLRAITGYHELSGLSGLLGLFKIIILISWYIIYGAVMYFLIFLFKLLYMYLI